MTKGYFVTGTDTEVGKSWCTVGLMAKLQQQGLSVIGMKPVASGCMMTTQGLTNEDARLIRTQSSVQLDYPLINPYAFAPPIAPHVAAEQINQRIEIRKIIECFEQIRKQADAVIVEGVGGWRVPLNESEYVSDLAVAIDLPVILVVGLRLGCINHALLSAESIRDKGCKLAGWIANSIDQNMNNRQSTIDAISRRIDTPLFATLPHLNELDADIIATYMNIDTPQYT